MFTWLRDWIDRWLSRESARDDRNRLCRITARIDRIDEQLRALRDQYFKLYTDLGQELHDLDTTLDELIDARRLWRVDEASSSPNQPDDPF